MGLERTGDLGAIWYGYHVVAIVRQWRLVTEDGSRILTGAADEVNDLMVSQQPLRFQVARPSGVARWPIITLEIEGASLRAVLGPREGV